MNLRRRFTFLTLTITLGLASSAAQAQKMYWSQFQTNNIHSAGLDGSGVVELIPGLPDARGIDVDAFGGKIYWADPVGGKVQRANLDGSGVEDVGAMPSVLGVALDLDARKLYWIGGGNVGAPAIMRADLDGAGPETLLSGADGLMTPWQVALDPEAGKMYWSDIGTDTVRRANLDGSSVEDILLTVTNPEGIALDTVAGKLYVVNASSGEIWRSNLDGTGLEQDLTDSIIGSPREITLDPARGKMYWTTSSCCTDETIQRADLDGLNAETLRAVPSGTAGHFGVALDLGSSEPSVAVCGETVHYAWVTFTNAGANANISYRNCNVAGACGAIRTLVAAPTGETRPAIACDGSVVGVAWEDARNGNPDIAYRRSSNGGASFAPLTFLVQAPSDDTRPALAMSGGVALLAWEDTRNKNKDIAYRRSSDGGVSWSTQAFLVRSALDEREPALDLDGSRALLTWMDQRHGSDDLAYRSSADAGASWAGLTFLVRSQDRESHPTVAVDGMNVLVGWVDERFGNQDLAFRRSTDGGASFARLTFLVKAPTDDAQIVMDLSGENGVLAWVDRRSANRNISFRHSSDAGLNWGSTARLVSAPSGEAVPACALAAGVATCAWDDTREREPLAHARESVSGGAAWGTRFELDEPN